MSETEAILGANEAFYRAFATRDMDAMDALWARDVPVACIHPGWSLLSGREAVMESWQQLLSVPGAPAIACLEPEAVHLGAFAYVTCYEQVGTGFLVATNLFVQEAGRWCIAHHHAGPTNGRPKQAPGSGAKPQPAGRLH